MRLRVTGPRGKTERFLRSREGSVAVTWALSLAMLFGFLALSIDLGSFYYDKRRQQSATDFAALAAAANIPQATAIATRSLIANGYSASDLYAVEPGVYVADPTLAPAARFTPQSSGANAVRITLRRGYPFIFGGLVGSASAAPISAGGSGSGDGSGITITTQATAASRNLAAFSLGSGLAQLDGGVVNSLLSSLIGSQISLSVMDDQALASTDIDLFAFSKALATRAGLTAGTYGALANGSVSLPVALGALQDAITGSSQADAAVSTVLSALGQSSSSLKLGALVDFGSFANLSLSGPAPATASIDAFDMLTALIQAANGTRQIQTAVNTSIPGLLNASVKLAIGQPPVGSSLAGIGPQGLTLHTAQMRLQITVQLVGPPAASLITLPIVVDVASGTATLQSVTCTGSDSSTAVVGIAATPSLAQAWLGTASNQDLTNLTALPSPSPAQLVNLLGLVTVTGSVSTAVTNTSTTLLTFQPSDIRNGTRQMVSTNDFLAPLLSSLVAKTQLSVSILGLNLYSPAAIQSAVAQTLAAATTPVDQLIASILSTLGIKVGNLTVRVSGVQCGRAVVVN